MIKIFNEPAEGEEPKWPFTFGKTKAKLILEKL